MREYVRFASFLLTPVLFAGIAAASIDGTESVVYVRSDCTGIDDCVETMPDLSAAIWNANGVRAGNHLLVDVGVGVFGGTDVNDLDGIFEYPPGTGTLCGAQDGNITIRGKGRHATRLKAVGVNGLVPRVTFFIKGCGDMGFQDLTIEGAGNAAKWIGPGSSTWANVDLIGTGNGFWAIAWYDAFVDGVNCGGKAVHYFFGNRFIASNAFVVWGSASQCDEVWFYGGDILVNGTPGHNNGETLGVLSQADGDVRLFGATLRVRQSDPDAPAGGVLTTANTTGVFAFAGGVFHMHGGIINVSVDPSNGPIDVTGLEVKDTGSLGHTPGTAFVLKPGGAGSAERLLRLSGGTVLSPFLWEAGATPPVSPLGDESPILSSVDGSDLFVETDCAASGDCVASGGVQPHLMIYSETACPVEKWFNTTTGRCRNVTP